MSTLPLPPVDVWELLDLLSTCDEECKEELVDQFIHTHHQDSPRTHEEIKEFIFNLQDTHKFMSWLTGNLNID